VAKSQRRRGAAYPITADAGPDWSFLKDYAEKDADEPESPEALRKRLRAEILAELGKKLGTTKEAAPVPPPKAQHIRNEGFDPFFEAVAAEEEARRRRRGH
jgi:hypothetical protein